MISFSSCFGVIGSQSLAQRSAPNTTMPRDCSRSRVAGVLSKPGKRKNGVLGVWWRRREAPFRPPHMPRLISSDGLLRRDPRQAAVAPGVMPDGMALGRDPRTSSGCSEADLPIKKKVARTHPAPAPPVPAALSAAMARHRMSARPRGRRAAGSAGSSSVPTRGVVAASTASTRAGAERSRPSDTPPPLAAASTPWRRQAQPPGR